MHCLVTGASGFLGSALVRHLLSRGHEVAVLLRPGGTPVRLRDCLDQVRTVYGDLENTELLRQAIQQQPIDAVVHLAWFGVTAEFRNSPQQISQNLVGTLAIWEAARAAGCRVWVGLGSQAEYGPCSGILREDMFPKPTTAYGVAKLAAGMSTAKMSELAGIRHVWLRLLSAYGPGDDVRHMLPSVILDLLARKKPALTLGEQVWDYLYVDDAAQAMSAVLEQEVTGIFNLGSGTTATIRDIVEQIRNMIDPSLPIGFGEIPYRSDQVMRLEADITRLTTATGWRPATSLERGLKQTIEWYREKMTG
ncbi:MAG TPA: NAD(P)-dependent oxidoreductase [Terriglobales bacterium]